MLSVAEISDSINSFPPHLSIYSIGQTHISEIQSIPSPCYSLGTQLSSYRFGFFATAPASAFRWGEPGPLLYKIIPPKFTMRRFPEFSRIPYGETFSTSNNGNFQVLCSPYSTPDCLIVNGQNNLTKLKSPSSSIDLFGLGVGVSNNGSTIVTVSRDSSNGNAIVHIFSQLNKEGIFFVVQHVPPITCRSKPPVVTFLNDFQVGISFPEIQKFIIYRYSLFDGWTIMKTLDESIDSFTQIDQNFITVNNEGKIVFYDKMTFFKRDVFIPFQNFSNGKFTKITSGKDWFAVLEESPDSRMIHVFTSRTSPLLRGIAIFVIFLLIAVMTIVLKENFNCGRIVKKIYRRRAQSKYSFKII